MFARFQRPAGGAAHPPIEKSVQELYTPRSEVELLVLKTMLSAYGIPYCVTSGFGAAYPGLQIAHSTTKTILVPRGAYEEATGLIQQYLSSPEPEYEPTRLRDQDVGAVLQVLASAITFSTLRGGVPRLRGALAPGLECRQTAGVENILGHPQGHIREEESQ